MADAGGGGGGGGLVKRTPQQVQAQNLMILQRKDEAVSEILATATYVVIYVFEPKAKQWERRGIEGSLFIVKRSYGVRFKLVVLNRIDPKDLEQDLTGSFTFEDMDPYLLYRTEGEGGKVETLSIWFHNEKDRASIVSCLRKVLRLQSTDKQAQDAQQAQTHQALLEPSAMLRAAPSPAREPLLEQSQPPSAPSQQAANPAASAAAAAGGGGGGGGGSGASSIEELLLKAASISKKEQRQQQASPAMGGIAGSSPPTVMDMLLRPQAASGKSPLPPSPGTAAASAGAAVPKGLLNPLALAGKAASNGGPSSKPASSSSSSSSVVLDKAQFKATLVAMLEEDAGFVDALHQAYLRKVGGGRR